MDFPSKWIKLSFLMPAHQNKRVEMGKKTEIKSFACSQSFSHFSAPIDSTPTV